MWPNLSKIKTSPKQLTAIAISGLGLLTIVIVVIAVGYNIQSGKLKTGFESDTTTAISTKRNSENKVIETTETITNQDAKTLWDWLSLGGVPLTLLLLGSAFQLLQQSRTEQQAIRDKEIAESNQREEALQNYFDRISELLIDKNIIAIADKLAKLQPVSNTQSTSEKPPETSQPAQTYLDPEESLLNAAKDVIRARTLSLLRRLDKDGERKGSVIQFLDGADVLSKLHLDLSSANLKNANLSGINFGNINLSNADISSANLNSANLNSANLSNANLNNAKLHGANLSHADLSEANLNNAKLHGANLDHANLDHAKLHGAKLTNAELRHANLHFAQLKEANLSVAFLSHADLSCADLKDACLTFTILRATNLHTSHVTDSQLQSAKLCHTQLPKDSKLNPDRDCPKPDQK